MANYLNEFLGLALIHFLAVMAPGPDFAVTIRQSVKYGRQAGIFTAIGIGAGISVHVLYTLLGVSALMHATPWLMAIAKIIGSAYLCYLAIQFLRSKPHNNNTEIENPSLESQSFKQAFLLGFMTNALNPKATLFFLAVFTTVVSETTPLSLQILYGIWMCCVNALWFILVSLIFSNKSVRNQFLRIGHWFERFMGIVLLAFAGRLILSYFR